MAVFIRCVLIPILSVMLLCCQGDVADDDYIDPYDMENFDPSTNTMRNKVHKEGKPVSNSQEEIQKETREKVTTSKPRVITEKSKTEMSRGGKQSSCSKESLPCVSLFRQYVKSLLYHIKGKVYSGAEDLNLRIKVSAADVEYLERYTDPSGREQDFHHVHEILSSMVKLASEVQYGEPSIERLWIETLLGMPLEKFFMFVVLAGVLVLIFVAATRFHFSWWKLTVKLVFFLFVISVFWQWYELYKKEEAKQHMAIMKEMPAGCRGREKDENIMTTFFRSLMSTFTFEKDECLQYYEHMLIDPFWKVTPTQALAKTVIRFFLSPMRDIGEAIREFFIGLLKDLPAQLWPVVLAAVAIFSFLLLFMYFGYRISLPFSFIAIEPGSRGDNSQVQRAITQQSEELNTLRNAQAAQMKEIMDMLKEERKAMQKQLENQEKFLAIQTKEPAVGRQPLPVESKNKTPDKAVSLRSAEKSVNPSFGCIPEYHVPKRQNESEGARAESPAEEVQEAVEGVYDISLDAKGNVVKSLDTESFEEISVSNIEADTIGQRDN